MDMWRAALPLCLLGDLLAFGCKPKPIYPRLHSTGMGASTDTHSWIIEYGIDPSGQLAYVAFAGQRLPIGEFPGLVDMGPWPGDSRKSYAPKTYGKKVTGPVGPVTPAFHLPESSDPQPANPSLLRWSRTMGPYSIGKACTTGVYAKPGVMPRGDPFGTWQEAGHSLSGEY